MNKSKIQCPRCNSTELYKFGFDKPTKINFIASFFDMHKNIQTYISFKELEILS